MLEAIKFLAGYVEWGEFPPQNAVLWVCGNLTHDFKFHLKSGTPPRFNQPHKLLFSINPLNKKPSKILESHLKFETFKLIFTIIIIDYSDCVFPAMSSNSWTSKRFINLFKLSFFFYHVSCNFQNFRSCAWVC